MLRNVIPPSVHRNAARGDRRSTSARCRAAGSLACLLACTPLHAQSPLPLESIKLPPGFAIEVVARVPNARAMTWGAAGTLFVGSAGEGSVYAVKLPPPGTKGEAAVSNDRVRIARAGGRGVSRRRAVRVGHLAHRALRRHRAPPRRSAGAGRRQRSLSRPKGTTGASSSRSDRTASSTSPSACRATSASRIPIATASSCG